MRRSVVMGLVTLGLAFAGLVLVFIVEHSNPVVRDAALVFTTSGMPGDVDERGGTLRLSYQFGRTSMQAPGGDGGLSALLETAKDAGEQVTIRNHLAGAHFDPETGLPVFPVQSVEYRGKTFGPFAAPVPWSWRVMRDEQLALLRGVALYGNGEHNAALAELNRGLATGVLRDAQRGVALAFRAEVLALKASAERTVIGSDYLLMRAAEDYDAAFKLRPGDYSLPNSRADVLARLGGVEEALAALDQAMKAVGVEHFKAGLLKAELLRRLGRYEDALATLDEVGARDAEQIGMMYHYHRGTTLLLMERYAQAAASFADGLKSQKNWPWAYIGRACARHRMGDPESARDDLAIAADLADRGARSGEESERAQRAELRNNLAALEMRGAAANFTMCQRFQPDFDGPPRARSKLLDAG